MEERVVIRRPYSPEVILIPGEDIGDMEIRLRHSLFLIGAKYREGLVTSAILCVGLLILSVISQVITGQNEFFILVFMGLVGIAYFTAKFRQEEHLDASEIITEPSDES